MRPHGAQKHRRSLQRRCRRKPFHWCTPPMEVRIFKSTSSRHVNLYGCADSMQHCKRSRAPLRWMTAMLNFLGIQLGYLMLAASRAQDEWQ